MDCTQNIYSLKYIHKKWQYLITMPKTAIIILLLFLSVTLPAAHMEGRNFSSYQMEMINAIEQEVPEISRFSSLGKD